VRFETKLLGATLVTVPVLLTQTPATALPCDNVRWCAQYSDDGDGGTNCGFRTFEQCRATVSGLGGGTNCGFLTLEQCRATVSGIGGFCVPNQLYNPCGPAGRRNSSGHRYY
jgi:Protein of unknown function (DUF3551)